MFSKIRNLRRRNVELILILAIAVFCLVYPFFILNNGFFNWQFNSNSDFKKMIVELLIWILVGLVGLKKKNVIWLAAELIVFTYLHLMLLPVAVAVAYAFITIEIGNVFCSAFIVGFKDEKEYRVISYYTGIMLLTITYAVLSFLDVASIKNIRIFNIFLLVILVANKIKRGKRSFKYQRIVATREYIACIAIMSFLMLAIGRANISLDYDSVWYGLRSAFALDNNSSIYQDLGLVGCVYSYSKGLEIYLLPVSSIESYGFVYAANILFGVFILIITYKILVELTKKRNAILGGMIMSAIPGIMNMTITAKSDILTLLFQLICIYFGILYMKHSKRMYFNLTVSTFLYTLTLKPSAIAFSSSIVLAFIFICFLYRIKIEIDSGTLIFLCVSVIDVALIWLRTFLITGLPMTSVLGGLFIKLGCKIKYPYSLDSQNATFRQSGLFDASTIKQAAKIFFEFFFAPQTENMDHVIIAWCTTLCTFLLLFVIIRILSDFRTIIEKVKKCSYFGFLVVLFWGEFIATLLLLWLLAVKPDGNYFMLFYAVTVITALSFYENVEENKKKKAVYTCILSCFIAENILFTGAVNWAWSAGFNNIKLINKGYYSHKEEFKNTMYSRGCVEIYNIISENPHNKVLALGSHPEVERFPCVVESILDIEYWGNASLTANIEDFIDYIQYVGFTYIYIEADYLSGDSKYTEYIAELEEKGLVKHVYEENSYYLLELDL